MDTLTNKLFTIYDMLTQLKGYIDNDDYPRDGLKRFARTVNNLYLSQVLTAVDKERAFKLKGINLQSNEVKDGHTDK